MTENLTTTQSNQAIGHQWHSTALYKFSLLPNFLLKLKVLCPRIRLNDEIVGRILTTLVGNNKQIALFVRNKMYFLPERKYEIR